MVPACAAVYAPVQKGGAPPTDKPGVMKCPKCAFEQIEESPDECAKCGILFEKWLDRAEQQERAAERLELELAPVQAAPRPVQPWEAAQPMVPRTSGLGSTFCQIGLLMVTLPILSFLINLVGFEFILLMPLEAFDDPTRAKFWTMGIGLVLVVVGAVMGGEIPDAD